MTRCWVPGWGLSSSARLAASLVAVGLVCGSATFCDAEDDVALCLRAVRSRAWEADEVWDKVCEYLDRHPDARLVEPLIGVLKDRDYHVQVRAMEALGAIKDCRAVVPILMAAAHWKPEDADGLSWCVTDALRKMGAAGTEALFEALSHPDAGVRTWAARGLSGLGGIPDAKRLTAALKDPEPSVRSWSALALMGSGDPNAIELLSGALDDPSPAVRADVVTAVAATAGARASDALLRALEDPDPEVRMRAAHGLADRKEVGCIDALLSLLNEPNATIRWRAAEQLNRFKDARAVAPLIAALKDKDSMVRLFAAGGLGDLGDLRAFEPLAAALRDPDGSVACSAAASLAQLDRARAIALFNLACREADLVIVRAAYCVLIEQGDPQTLPALVKALRKKGSEGMATVYINCGNPTLAGAGYDWAFGHGYRVSRGPGASGPSWGSP